MILVSTSARQPDAAHITFGTEVSVREFFLDSMFMCGRRLHAEFLPHAIPNEIKTQGHQGLESIIRVA